MRHIKLYEEYSDDDLKDLIGDLETIGLAYKPKLGVDYGYTSKLFAQKPKDLERPINVFLTKEAVNYMVKKGIAEYSGWNPEHKESTVRLLPKDQWVVYGAPYMGSKPIGLRLNRHQETYMLAGISGEYGFGTQTSWVKKIGKSSRSYCQNWFIEKIQKEIEKLGSI